jgi:transcriptional regulator with XRE-family HTH domain
VPSMESTISGGRTEFGAWLKAARTRAGLSQEQLALEAGVNHKTVQRTEAGISQPRRAVRLALTLTLAEHGQVR